MSNKRLHIHSIPLALFAVVATAAVATVGIGSIGFVGSGSLAREALIRPMVRVAPTSTIGGTGGMGMATVQFNQPPTDAEQLRQAVDKAISKSEASAASTTSGAPVNGNHASSNLAGASLNNIGHAIALQLLVD